MHPALDRLVGTWRLEGRQLEGPFGPAVPVAARETYEWLAGDKFLVHRFEGTVGGAPAACIELISHDDARGVYPRVSYYNDGAVREWESREKDGTWIVTQAGRAEPGEPRTRCTLELGDGGRTMTENWEYSNDGLTWRTFWDVRAMKETR
ncbi:MAG TPA: DUF1579 family protein [Myxococcota bacterium]|nr:DUF1579 family protein [Myxococcota bacterium]